MSAKVEKFVLDQFSKKDQKKIKTLVNHIMVERPKVKIEPINKTEG
jgi:peptidyl-tRNA hydrolase